MTERATKFHPMALIVNSAAIGLTCLVLTMDCSAFLFWLALGVFDGHWNDVSLQVLFVCLIISFLFLLIVAALCGLAIRISTADEPGKIKPLTELGSLIEGGWDKALRTTMSCMLVVLTLLLLLCLSFWRDLLWWSEVQRGRRASQELRPALSLYEASAEVASADRKPISLLYAARDLYVQKNYADADRYYQRAIEDIKALPGDNRAMLIAAYQELSQCYTKAGKPEQAEAVLREAIKTFGDIRKPLPRIQMRLLGAIFIPDPNPQPTLIGTYTLLEGACIKQGKFVEAENTFIENLSTFKNFDQPSIKAIIGVTDLYANLLSGLRQNRDRYIDNAYSVAQSLVAEKFGQNSEAMGRMEISYADRLKSIDRFNDAEKQYKLGLERLLGNLKTVDAVALRAMNSLASIQARSDNVDAAIQTYKDAMALAQKWGDKSPDVQIQYDAISADYGALLRKLGRTAEADALGTKTDKPEKKD